MGPFARVGAAVNDQLIGGGIELAADKAEVIPRAVRRQMGAAKLLDLRFWSAATTGTWHCSTITV